MKTLKLAEDLKLPLDVVTEKLAWLGRTGSGKTYGAMKLAELMLDAGAQIGALDPVGVWRGLRVPASKGGQSYAVVVFGGLTPDIPIEPTEAAGAVIADFVCDRALSFVLDVSQFIPAEQQRIVRGFAARFFQRRKATPAAVHLFMEECQEFIPENPSGRDEQLTLGHMQRMWKLGRNFGIGGSLISQRPQEIAKKALNMSGTLFAFQMTGPQERDAVKKWVADHEVAGDIVGVLQTLQRGQPHVEMRIETQDRRVYQHSGVVAILPRVTADLSSTPQVGASKVATRPLTPLDLKELTEQLQATIEKAKADDPRELRKRIADLDGQLRKQAQILTSAQAVKENVPTSTKNVLTDADRELLGKVATALRDRLSKASDEVLAARDRVERVVQGAISDYLTTIERVRNEAAADVEVTLERVGLQKVLAKLEGVTAPPVKPSTTALHQAPARAVAANSQRAVAPRPAPISANGAGDPSVGKAGLRRMLIALAQRPQGLTRSQLGLRARVSAKGGSFDTYLSKARVSGWVDTEGERIRITQAGVDALGNYEPLPEGAALLEHYIAEFGSSGAARMLRAIADAYPRTLTRAEVSEQANVSAQGGSFDTYLSKLRTLELVQGKAELKASDELFD